MKSRQQSPLQSPLRPAPANGAAVNDPASRTLFVRGLTLTGAGMALGLVLEGLIGYKTPGYLQDPLRRELFRLAHTHLALLGLLVALCALGLSHWRANASAATCRALLAGALLMPLGFFLGGVSHPEGDPGPGIWLAPVGALLVLYGLSGMILALREKAKEE